jgi:nucleotide-binding universal stress UspA family protein
MLRSVLIGVDGSPYSRTAVELGIGWAGRTGAMLVGLGIIDEPDIRTPTPIPLGASYYKEHRDERLVTEARRQAEQALDQFSHRCVEAGVPSKLLEVVGEPHEQIRLESQRFDLIILGRQTYFDYSRHGVPCETLEKVLRDSPRPVVTVPEMLPAGSSIMVAYDGSLQAARAVQAFQASGLGQGQEIHVVTLGELFEDACRIADRAVEFLGSHQMKVTRHVLTEGGRTGEVLLGQARKLEAGLIVMGAYGRSAMREFFFGSATRTLLRESPIPLFVFH